jgi:hypothetical protein
MNKCIVCDAKSKHPVQCAFSHFRLIDTSENYFKYLKGNSQMAGSYWGGLLSVLGLTFPFFDTIRHWEYRKVRLGIEGITDQDGNLLTNQTCFIDKDPQ